MNIAKFLTSLEAFSCLSYHSAERLAQRVEIREYKPQEPIIRRGDPGDCMFILWKGEVRIPILDEDGRLRFLTHLHEGQLFGEMALLTGEPRNADVVAETECTCIRIEKDTLQALMHEHPEISRFLTVILGERLNTSGGIRKVGKYKLIDELGRGGMSVVFEGFHPQLERAVAIKMLSHELVYHREFSERFRNEAKIIAGLRHPNIVEVFDTEEAYATLFIIMEKVSGLDLRAYIRSRESLPYEEVRRVLCEVAAALDFAHSRGVIHRDVKPSNIIITPEGNLKLMDFGLAMTRDMQQEAQASSSVGTPCYMAPEQIVRKEMDARVDIYALGIIAYEMLTGAPPFFGEVLKVLKQHIHETVPSPRDANPAIPKDLDTFVRKATQKMPNDRFSSCKEIISFLNAHQRTAYDPDMLGVRTMTFVYHREDESEVQAMLKDFAARARKVKGVKVF